jgi:DNA-binding CsgD family transcriptional regulator
LSLIKLTPALNISATARMGLSMAGLFGWILTFPMFGKLLIETAGAAGSVLGLTFVISHGLGLMLLQLLPSEKASARPLIIMAGGIIAALTVVYVLFNRNLWLDILIMAVFGLTAAYLVLAWVCWFASAGDPLVVLALAMAGANLIYAGISMPGGLSLHASFILVVVLAVAGILSMETKEQPLKHRDTKESKNPSQIIIMLAAFAVAAYFVGGIWYRVFTVPEFATPDWDIALNSLMYVAAILFLASLARGGQPGNLAFFSLSSLGIGLLIAASQPVTIVIVFAYHVALGMGLAAADLFYWYALWSVGKIFGIRRTYGYGLGFSLLLIALSVIIAQAGRPDHSVPVMLLMVAVGVIFLMIPLIFRRPFQFVEWPFSEMAAESPGNHASSPPVQLTQMESKVFEFLMVGASDAEISEKLIISKHTVKFHVRNILRKTGASNRKILLSQKFKNSIS